MRGIGGLPAPRPDQLRQPAVPALQPGSSNTIRARVIIVSGDGDGVFIYQGAPALGNSPIFWASPGLVDPFGNVLPATAGIAESGVFQAENTIITPAGIFFYSPSPGTGNLILSFAAAPGTDQFGNDYPRGTGLFQADTVTGNEHNLLTGAASEGVPAQLYTFVDNPGAANEQMQVNLQSAQSTSMRDRAIIALLSAAADLSQPNAIGQLGYIKAGGTTIFPMLSWGPGGIFSIGTTNAAAPGASPASPAVAATWQLASLQNGWGLSGTGFAQYKLYSDNTVGVRFGGLVPGTIADGTEVWAIPAAYTPTFTDSMGFPIVVNYTAAPAFGSSPELVPKNNGQMQCFNLRGTVASITGGFRYPLD